MSAKLSTIDGFNRIGEQNAFAVLARANELAAAGKSIINLGIGQPDFPTPQHIVDAAIEALQAGHHGYTPATGIPELQTYLLIALSLCPVARSQCSRRF